MTIEIKGNWKKGFAYDVHTLDSVDEYGHIWLQELGHTVEISEHALTKVEGLSGPYQTKQYHFQIDHNLNLSLQPFAIWLIGADG